MKELWNDVRSGALPMRHLVPFAFCVIKRLVNGTYRNANDEAIARQA